LFPANAGQLLISPPRAAALRRLRLETPACGRVYRLS